MKNKKTSNKEEISRKDALKKIGNYGKYAALTAIGTYTLLKSTVVCALIKPISDVINNKV